MDKLQEQNHLEFVNSEIKKQISNLKRFVSSLKKDIISEQQEFRDNRSNTKYKDLKKNIKDINTQIFNYDEATEKLTILNENLKSAYFGSIVFDEDKFYIGKFSVQNSDGTNVLVNDWRAPISSVFYEFELGQAHYLCPAGLIEGNLTKKMQYKIEDSNLIYLFDTSVTIRDEILQQALAESSSTKMKTIVSTIQKKQNQIIRLPLNKNIVVQGVAGSGKTSIALHRIAYLLYNNRKNLNSKNILVFSPNNVFSSYIGSVLPELGEENVKEISFDEIFKEEYAGIASFEKRHVAIEKLLEGNTSADTTYKNSEQCLVDLNKYLNLFFEKHFEPKNIIYNEHDFSVDLIKEFVNAKKHQNIFERLLYAASGLVARVEVGTSLTTNQSEKLISRFFLALLKMLKQKNVFKIYGGFLASKKFKFKNNEALKFEDAINILYIKNYIFGAKQDNSVKHVVIDEMQDYSPVALNVIKQMYNCTFTCLGDVYQTIDGAFNRNKLDYIAKVFDFEGETLELKQNYRSTFEIANFANQILGLKFDERPVRNGEQPKVVSAEVASIEVIKQAQELNKKYKTVGVICKTMGEALRLYTEFKRANVDANLIRPENMGFAEGISISAAHVVKGLEFDAIVIANANSEIYKTPIDRQSLYVGVTRALHEVVVVFDGTKTEFLK